MTKAKRMGEWLAKAALADTGHADRAYNKRRFTSDLLRFGAAPPTAPPLPERKPVVFDPPTKYEERHGG